MKKRFQHLEDSPITAWRVTKDDWKHHKNYNRYLEAFDQMLTRTNTPYAPWRVMESEDRRWAAVRASETIIQQMEQALAKRQNSLPAPLAPIDAPEKFQLVEVSPLGAVEPARDFDESLYKETLKQLQKQLRRLHNKLYLRKIPVVIVYEGWDAAGKGGNIKRVTAALDPRGYEVVPIAAPTPDELRHHYLWRFWNQLPKTGHIAIFDRSWYGRVMVERIEGFCSENDWRRAYTEMNEFERTLTQWGAVVIKFWLHIDQEEQLRRFTLRQQTPEKQWKITDEDWRNREKWPQYEVAVNDMLRYTSTDFAPWHIIESNNKKFARIKALKIIIRALEERMRK